jgi:hypothetical protein
LTLYLNEPYLSRKGGYGHEEQAALVARDRGLDAAGVRLRNPLAPVCIAWLVLLATGLLAAFTGQIDLTLLGHPIAGERFPFVAGLAASGLAIWGLGARTGCERQTCLATLAAACVAFIAAPIDFTQYSAGWWSYQAFVWLAQIGLCLQLAAWAAAARKAQRLGLWIMCAGMGAEAFGLFPYQILSHRDAACAAGMVLTCMAGPFVAMALPALITLALMTLWLGPLHGRLERR